MYSSILNTWLLIQSPLISRTVFDFSRLGSGLATWKLHPEKLNTLVFLSRHVPLARDVGCINMILLDFDVLLC